MKCNQVTREIFFFPFTWQKSKIKKKSIVKHLSIESLVLKRANNIVNEVNRFIERNENQQLNGNDKYYFDFVNVNKYVNIVKWEANQCSFHLK